MNYSCFIVKCSCTVVTDLFVLRLEQQEWERQEREKQERERQERERQERERLERERLERERQAAAGQETPVLVSMTLLNYNTGQS